MPIDNFIVQTIASMQKQTGLKPGVIPGKTPVWKYPIRWQREYQANLVRFVKATQRLYRDIILSKTLPIFRQRDILFNNDSSYRIDDGIDDLESLNNEYDAQLNIIKDESIKKILKGIPEGINEFNSAQWKKIIRKKLGIDLFTNEPWLDPMVRVWIKSNTSLITKMLDDQISSFNETILRNYSSGERHTTMIDDIRKAGKTSVNRAKLIARDQTNKLNGDMMHQRQTDIGISFYVWMSSDDIRVRKTHTHFDGKRYSWKTGSPEGNPGNPIQCRCWADPDWTELDNELKSVD